MFGVCAAIELRTRGHQVQLIGMLHCTAGGVCVLMFSSLVCCIALLTVYVYLVAASTATVVHTY